MRPGLPLAPSSPESRFPRPGADSSISAEMPSRASRSRAYSHTGVSLPVGMYPVFTEGMLTRSW